MSKPEKQPEVLSKEEVRALLSQPNRRYPTGLRNYVMMAIMYHAGLRVSEVLNLLPHHINTTQNYIYVKAGKGKKDRTVPIEPWLTDAIATWQAHRIKLPKEHPNIFTTLKGKPIDSRYIREMVAREAKAAGIERRVHAHMLRHSYATSLINEHFVITEVQQLLGHKNISTTQVYLHVEPIHLAKKIAARNSRLT